MRRFLLPYLAVLALAALVLSCTPRERVPTESGVILGRGSIVGLGPTCGFLIAADGGRLYEPVHLAPEFEMHGLRVTFMLRQRTDMASVCMAGPIVDVVWMQRL